MPDTDAAIPDAAPPDAAPRDAAPHDPAGQLTRLLAIMARLRAPDGGCPWDLAQDFATIAPYTIEEAYEVADAIARYDMAALPDELGDLLFQVVYHARLGEESGHFAFADIARAIADKMIRRHPHVFGAAAARTAAAQAGAWEAQKAAERRARDEHGALAGIPVGLPGLTRAAKLGARAARVGFDWPDTAGVLAKLDEEVAELRAELPGADPARLADELGDVLFHRRPARPQAGPGPRNLPARGQRQVRPPLRRRGDAVGGRWADPGGDCARSARRQVAGSQDQGLCPCTPLRTRP